MKKWSQSRLISCSAPPKRAVPVSFLDSYFIPVFIKFNFNQDMTNNLNPEPICLLLGTAWN